MAEIFSEFDEPSPDPAVFCQRISSEELERRSAQNTQAELNSLFNYLEANPKEFYKILRRKKANDLNIFELVKVKVLNKLKDNYLEKYFPEEECQKELDSLTRNMASAFNYGQEAKGSVVRFSRRLLEKRKLQPLECSTPKIPTAPPMPPPPPPPPTPPPLSDIKPILSKSKKRKTAACVSSTPSGTFWEVNESLIQSIRNVPARRKLREMDAMPKKGQSESFTYENETHSSVVITQTDISVARKSLRSTRSSSSPDESPYQLCKARKENEPHTGSDFSLFNQQLIDKFRNARSPSNSPSGNIFSDSGFESP